MAGVQQMARVPKPGGLFVMTVWDALDVNPAVAIINEIIQASFASDPPGFLKSPFGYCDVAVVSQLLQDSGLGLIDVMHVSVSDHHHAATGFAKENPTVVEIEARATITVDAFIDQLAAAFETALGPTPTAMPFQDIVFTAQKP